jgi:hypothetical protein
MTKKNQNLIDADSAPIHDQRIKTTTIASNESGYLSEPTSNIGVKRRCITAFICLRLRLSSWSDRWPLRSIWSPASFYRES